MTDEFFKALTKTEMRVSELHTIIQAATIVKAKRVVINGYPNSGIQNPWIAFDLDDKMFALWRATGKLYECDQHGAAADDPITTKELRRKYG